jgi:signal transduction histidine kinase/CheY-like chemotaxis protein
MVAEIEKLQKQIENLKAQLVKEKKTNQLLKKRTLQAILGTNGAGQSQVDQSACEVDLARAELSSRVKSVFLENVSHEIRSSMNGIVGMTDLVLETELSSEQRQYLEMVGSSVDRLLVVVNEVLDLSRIETGELELYPEDFNFKESLDHDLYVLNLSARNKDIDLVCTIEPDVPAYVHGDPARLVQIVTNLVNNAIKFTTTGGVFIKIENGGYDFSNNILLRFNIRDTGCGIAPDKLEQINYYFKQKAKPHVALPLSVGTTGLGLTVTSQLVKLMGGEIGAESTPEETTFWFTLPFKEVADLSSIEEKANATLEGIEEEITYALRGAKVLLAEDEYINRVLIETILKQLGVEVTSVTNGRQAVDEACAGGYQLVLMDVQMDGVDGLEATRLIRKHESKHGGHLDIIALTALAMPGDREKCLQAGMDDYLPKPVQRNALISVLAQFLTNRVLVVDGDPASQNVFVRTLVEAGWQVTIAETRRSAMYEASLSHFDLIVFDLSTPQLEGMEAVKIIRQLEDYSGQRTQIFGIGEERVDAELQKQGFDGYIQRPVTKDKILQQLEVFEMAG